MWSPNLALVTQFHTEIHMVRLLYEIGNRLPVGSQHVLTVDVAENIGAIFYIRMMLFYSYETENVFGINSLVQK